MELQLATTEDLVNELKRRRLRFVFVAVEDTNSARDDLFCVAGRGNSSDDLMHLIQLGQEAFSTLEDQSEGADEDDEWS